ncbi:MAG: 50S ribosomal protein L30 [Acidobacteria bacterium]|nr:50S ribosomal protein L30 [Acidobacteriota bacterium]NIM60800.1 50S ribosomal protein L30 [Acidobacteriota bacterium]NIQ83485.1 50S ribosomal protein L30 [Acidobacteriota bacterium]NIT09726.1 50S ribosomal protein L30 [Acidobacteriota bacterium]
MSAKAKAATLRVRQVKSGIGFSERQKATLKALGFGKVGRTRELPDNPAVRGMLAKIPHLLSVQGKADKASAKEER